MKRCWILLLAAALTVQLCGCAAAIPGGVTAGESSESQEASGETSAEPGSGQSGNSGKTDSAETSAAETSASGQEAPEKSAETSSAETSASVPVSQMTDEQIAAAYLSQRSVWENADIMSTAGTAGFYSTGYVFFDIDLDGKKELAVQLGGGSMNNCTTEFYRLDDKDNVVRYTDVNNIFSLAVEDLSLAKAADGSAFYLMHYHIKSGPAESWEYWAEIVHNTERHDYGERVRFAKVTTTAADGSETYTYYVGNDQTDEESYTAAYDVYMAGLTVTAPAYGFISYSDWTGMDDAAKTAALLASLKK